METKEFGPQIPTKQDVLDVYASTHDENERLYTLIAWVKAQESQTDTDKKNPLPSIS